MYRRIKISKDFDQLKAKYRILTFSKICKVVVVFVS